MSFEATDFLSCVDKSGLIPDSSLRGWLATNESQLADADPIMIAQAMVADELLTQWQASKLLRGKWNGFFVDQYKILDWDHVDEEAELTFYTAVCTRTGERVLLACLPKSNGIRPDGTVGYRIVPVRPDDT